MHMLAMSDGHATRSMCTTDWVPQIDIATCLWARYILMNSIPSAQIQATHMRHATCDCDVRHAMRRHADSMPVRLRPWHATSDEQHKACNHECGVDGGGMGVHVGTNLDLKSDGCRNQAFVMRTSARVPSLPTQQLMPDTVRKIPVRPHIDFCTNCRHNTTSLNVQSGRWIKY